MKVSIRNWEEFSQAEAVYGNPIKLSEVFDVKAIISFDRDIEKYYIICDGNKTNFHRTYLFKVIDNETPENWVHVYYSKVRKLTNPSYNFIVTIKEFLGPREIIEDKNFLFDLYDNPDIAFDFLQNLVGSTNEGENK